jgi:hypothetical protein
MDPAGAIVTFERKLSFMIIYDRLKNGDEHPKKEPVK